MKTIGYKAAADALWEQAVEICNLTHFWQPDCTLALMHSAIGPLIAAIELWQLTFNQPDPNVVKSNLGREKIERYNAIPRPSVFDWIMRDQEDTLGIGHFMAWVSFQENWVRQLKAQVEAVLGEQTPMRILVVDDLHMEGGTLQPKMLSWNHCCRSARQNYGSNTQNTFSKTFEKSSINVPAHTNPLNPRIQPGHNEAC